MLGRVLAGCQLLALLLAGVGCASSSTHRPTSAIDAYAAALRSGEYSRAYELMSVRYRKEHSRDEYVRMLKDSPADVKETAARLRAGRRQVEVTAELRYGELGDRLQLVEERGRWRIATDPLNFYPQDTPQSALRSFLRAITGHRYGIALRFVPDEYRRFMTEADVRQQFEGDAGSQNQEILRLLTANLDSPIEQQGDAARMPFGDRYEVKFKREDGVWKIEDLY